MPGKKYSKKYKKKYAMRGEGFFGDVWKGIKKGATEANKFARKTKLASAG